MMSAQRVTQPIPLPQHDDLRRLCLGGSFDPVHSGHLITSRFAAEALGLPGVRLIPARGNPHKPTGPIASDPDRLAMCRLAVGDDPYFVVDPQELDRPPPSYAIDTAAAIAGTTGVRVPWLIGSDLLARLPTWHRFDELLERVEFVVMRRAGHPIDRANLDPRVASLVEQAIEVPAVELSATLIRARVQAGEPIEDCVPAAVSDWIWRHRLYASPSKSIKP